MEGLDEVRRIVAAATANDHVEPLNEAALLRLRHEEPGDDLRVVDGGFAWLHDAEVELVVAPDRRGRGIGERLAKNLPAGPLTAWSHGNHPAAARLADLLGWTRVRELWLMRRSLRDEVPETSIANLRTWRPGDEEEFLRVNARAFAHHPEQGRMTRADLDERLAEPWFDPTGFFLAFDEDEKMLGYHWTKVHKPPHGDPPFGEVYVLGVSPDAQGRGLGPALTQVGLRHLRDLGLNEVVLYVEADNAPALRIYDRLGFTHAAADTDVRYARVTPGSPGGVTIQE